MRENVRIDGSSMARIHFASRTNWSSTMDCGGRFTFPQSVTEKGAGGWVDLDTGLVNVAGFGSINLQGNVKHNFTNFAPRLGIAYQATPKTVVRLGYGRSFDLGVFGSNFGHTATQNLPVLVAQQINPSSNTASVFDLSHGPTAPIFPKVPDLRDNSCFQTR